MRILIVNTSETVGGAAVAANRLVAALNNNGEKAMMLVRDKTSDSITVNELPRRGLMRLRFIWERMVIFLNLGLKKNHLWEIDIANAGSDITKLQAFKDADVIHLSWINQGMISLCDIKRIVKSRKPIVWTMHDLWPATAICHYAGECDKFVTGCHNCPLLPGGGNKYDLSSVVWKRKKSIYKKSSICFVTCSRWLEGQARKSKLLEGMFLTSIPNPIDTNIFNPQDKEKCKERIGIPTDKKVILFVANKVTDERKGAGYLVTALEKLCADQKTLADNCVVALLGGSASELAEKIPMPVFPIGYISGDRNLALVYNAADVFVLPSLADNLPNTIMEALACGVPCVGFNIGGIPEMIDHKQNGYVAKKADVDDLAAGLRWVLDEANTEDLSHSAITKVSKHYSQNSVSMKYIEVYNQALAQKRYLR